MYVYIYVVCDSVCMCVWEDLLTHLLICYVQLQHMAVEAGTSPICKANLPVLVRRPVAAVEPGRASVPVPKPAPWLSLSACFPL